MILLLKYVSFNFTEELRIEVIHHIYISIIVIDRFFLVKHQSFKLKARDDLQLHVYHKYFMKFTGVMFM